MPSKVSPATTTLVAAHRSTGTVAGGATGNGAFAADPACTAGTNDFAGGAAGLSLHPIKAIQAETNPTAALAGIRMAQH